MTGIRERPTAEGAQRLTLAFRAKAEYNRWATLEIKPECDSSVIQNPYATLSAKPLNRNFMRGTNAP
eukprot:4220164-Pyramimonas_sp.AAC.1